MDAISWRSERQSIQNIHPKYKLTKQLFNTPLYNYYNPEEQTIYLTSISKT